MLFLGGIGTEALNEQKLKLASSLASPVVDEDEIFQTPSVHWYVNVVFHVKGHNSSGQCFGYSKKLPLFFELRTLELSALVVVCYPAMRNESDLVDQLLFDFIM